MADDIFFCNTGADLASAFDPDIPILCAFRETIMEHRAEAASQIFSQVTLCNIAFDLVYSSRYCINSLRLITRDELATANIISGAQLINDLQRVILFENEDPQVTNKYIFSLSDFCEVLKFSEKYDLNIEVFCKKQEHFIWLHELKAKYKKEWENNAILLTLIEKHSMTNKFPVNAATVTDATPVDYPAAPRMHAKTKAIFLTEIPRVEIISQENLLATFEILFRNRMFDLMRSLFILLGTSLEYYDLIFSNADLIELLNLEDIKKCVAFYASRIMFLEEIAMYARKRSAGRFIRTIDSVAKLSQLSEGYALNNNLIGTVRPRAIGLLLPGMIAGKRGIYSLSKFKKRFDIFTESIFDNLEWCGADHKTAVVGSTIAACAIKNPLEHYCESAEDYFNSYYPRNFKTRVSENDIMKKPCAESIFFKEMKISKKGKERIEDDEEEENEEDEEKNDNVTEPQNSACDIDLMVCCAIENFTSIAERHFANIRKTVADFNRNITLTIERVETENKFKFCIKGLGRNIDLFHVADIPSVIVKFHLDCVRAWYDGSDVYCFPTFVTAAYTGLNVNMRWTSNKKDIRDVVMKYFRRGFGTFMSMVDYDNIKKYINSPNSVWPTYVPIQNYNGRRWSRREKAREPFYFNFPAIFNCNRKSAKKVTFMNHNCLIKKNDKDYYQTTIVRVPTNCKPFLPYI